MIFNISIIMELAKDKKFTFDKVKAFLESQSINKEEFVLLKEALK